MFPPDAAQPQVFDEKKDKKDMKDSWNSVLDLLAYSKCPIQRNSGPEVQNNSPKTLTLLDDGTSFSGWYCTLCETIKRTFGSLACVLNC